jgi:hypothetical protein
MRTLLFVFLSLHLTAFADEVRIAVGMDRDKAVDLIKLHSGKDITSGLAIIGPKGEWPLKGIYWAFRDYDAIIALDAKEGKVVGLSFWTNKDFDESKSHRAKTEQRITALKIDTKTKGVSIEKKKKQG